MMKRGDIYFVSLDSTVGSEIKKKRPAIIISNNAANKHAKLVTIIPLTSNTNHMYLFEVIISQADSKLKKDSKAQCYQIRTVSKLRLGQRRAGFVKLDIMQQVEAALKLHLGIDS